MHCPATSSTLQVQVYSPPSTGLLEFRLPACSPQLPDPRPTHAAQSGGCLSCHLLPHLETVSQGKFEYNGGCGYLLKPEFMCRLGETSTWQFENLAPGTWHLAPGTWQFSLCPGRTSSLTPSLRRGLTELWRQLAKSRSSPDSSCLTRR